MFAKIIILLEGDCLKHDIYINTRQEGLSLYWTGREHDNHPNGRYGQVIRDIYIVECCTGGAGSVIINGAEFPVKAGDCYVLFPGDVVTHTNGPENPRDGVWCGIYGLQVGNWLAEMGISSQQPYAPKRAFETVNRYIEEILSLEQKRDPGAAIRQVACLYSIFGELLSYSSQQVKEDGIQRAIYMMETYYHKSLSVTRLAEEAGFERAYFTVRFKERTGMSPGAYLRDLRLQKACVLLKQGYTSAQAATAVGFAPENFSRLFRRYLNQTPGAYRINGPKAEENYG